MQPAYLCFGEKFPGKKDVETMKCYMEVSRYLRQYKEVKLIIEERSKVLDNTLTNVLVGICHGEGDACLGRPSCPALSKGTSREARVVCNGVIEWVCFLPPIYMMQLGLGGSRRR